MPLERIEDEQVSKVYKYEKKMPCLNEDHNPPSHIHLEPGRYRHICPGCGKVTTFEVPFITC